MIRFLFTKFLLAFFTIFVTTILVTLLIHIVPGDPVQIMFAQSQGSTPEQIEQVRINLGLDQPIYIQYLNYIDQLSKGDLYVVPKGIDHKPVAEKECKVMLVELKGTKNTGSEIHKLTAEDNQWI